MPAPIANRSWSTIRPRQRGRRRRECRLCEGHQVLGEHCAAEHRPSATRAQRHHLFDSVDGARVKPGRRDRRANWRLCRASARGFASARCSLALPQVACSVGAVSRGTSMNERFDLTGRTVIITGGGKGIGKVYSEEFAKAGAHVVAADIDGAAAKAVAEALVAQGLRGARCLPPTSRARNRPRRWRRPRSSASARSTCSSTTPR